MNHRTHVRAAQDAVLRDSLVGSSMSILTLVVAALVAVRLLGLVATTIVDAPPVVEDGPRHDIIKYFTDQGFVPAVLPDVMPPDPGIIVPVDETAPNLVDEVPPLVPAAPTDPGSFTGTERPGAGGPGGGTGVGTGEAPIPPRDAPIYHEEIPAIVNRVMPVYPDLARQAGLEGRVTVAAFVGVDGRVKRAEVEGKSSVFDAAALAAVRQWTFTPAKTDQHPVAVWVRVPVVFRLH
jgi:TonB family protein